MIKKQRTGQYKEVLTELSEQSEKPHSTVKITFMKEDQEN